MPVEASCRALLKRPVSKPSRWPKSSSVRKTNWTRLTDAAAQGGLQDALDLKMQREKDAFSAPQL